MRFSHELQQGRCFVKGFEFQYMIPVVDTVDHHQAHILKRAVQTPGEKCLLIVQWDHRFSSAHDFKSMITDGESFELINWRVDRKDEIFMTKLRIEARGFPIPWSLDIGDALGDS